MRAVSFVLVLLASCAEGAGLGQVPADPVSEEAEVLPPSVKVPGHDAAAPDGSPQQQQPNPNAVCTACAKDVALDGDDVCIVRIDGSLKCSTGVNGVPSALGFARIALNVASTQGLVCALRHDASLACWDPTTGAPLPGRPRRSPPSPCTVGSPCGAGSWCTRPDRRRDCPSEAPSSTTRTSRSSPAASTSARSDQVCRLTACMRRHRRLGAADREAREERRRVWTLLRHRRERLAVLLGRSRQAVAVARLC